MIHPVARTATSPRQILASTITGDYATSSISAGQYTSLVFGITVAAMQGEEAVVRFQLETSFDEGTSWIPYGKVLEVSSFGHWLLHAGAGTLNGDFGDQVRVACRLSGRGAAAVTTIYYVGK